MSRGTVSGNGIVTDGLMFAIDAANPKSYTSGSTVWNDITFNNNNGSLINGPTFNSANRGSIVFDGVDDYFQTIIPSYFTNTICIWFYPISGTGLFLYGDNNATPICLIDYNTSGNLRVYVQNYYQTYSAIITINTWNHISLILNNPTRSVYVNGNFIGSNTYNGGTNQNGVVRLGVQNFIGYGNSRISMTTIYNRALSATEVLQNYNATKTRFGL